MTAKLFAVTNPVFGTSTMQSLSNKFDNSFISRVLVWFQDENHYKQVTKKHETDLQTVSDDFEPTLLLSLYDHCSSFKAIFDPVRVLQIYEASAPLIADYMRT